MDYGLSTQQLLVICALSSGATTLAAAEQAGVHRNTIHNWRRNSPPFQDAFAHAQYDRALYFREKSEALVELAFQTLHQILADPNAPASVRLKAALAIITAATTPPSPMQQVQLDIEKMVFSRAPAQTVTEDQFETPAAVHNPAQPDVPPAPGPTTDSPAKVNNSAQPAPSEPHQPAAPPAPAQAADEPPEMHNSAQPSGRNAVRNGPRAGGPGRNHPCPCRSGKKFKRCCMNKEADQPQPMPAAA